MKKIQIFLSIYFLLLACMPCTDVGRIVNSQLRVEALDSGERHHGDCCPPFCICNCCGSVVFSQYNTTVYSFFQNLVIAQRKSPEHESVFITSFFGNIWQPPKLSA